MKHSDKITPVAAVLSAAVTLVCCLPVGFAAAAATASLSTVVAERRSWFLAAASVLLLVGFVEVSRSRRLCPTRGGGSLAVLVVSALVVGLVAFFPQVVATILADLLP